MVGLGLGQGRAAAGRYMAPGIVQQETRFVGHKAAEGTVGKSKSFVVEAGVAAGAGAGAGAGRIRKLTMGDGALTALCDG